MNSRSALHDLRPRSLTFKLRLSAIMVGATLICSGCTSIKSYVDPQFRDATYQSIQNTDAPKYVTVSVEFQVNGKPQKRHNGTVYRKVSRVLAATRLFAEASAGKASESGQLHVIVNNVGDVGAAFGKGFATGLTFGLAGSQVVDGYIMTATYTPLGGVPTTREYKHAIHSTVGMHSAPEGMVAVPLADAFDQVVEEMLLNYLRDLQSDRVL
ncbi:MAG: hypothetical protein GMKNLPBB_03318 [Myxococcota bacterium]|nr:hypothetical protein [Myxococcota bacterium]